jgi:hypothetical protein
MDRPGTKEELFLVLKLFACITKTRLRNPLGRLYFSITKTTFFARLRNPLGRLYFSITKTTFFARLGNPLGRIYFSNNFNEFLSGCPCF